MFRWATRPLDSSQDHRYLEMEWVRMRRLAIMNSIEISRETSYFQFKNLSEATPKRLT
jgi:hypothetical protein